jgi:hypothetical protein
VGSTVNSFAGGHSLAVAGSATFIEGKFSADSPVTATVV